MKSLCKKCVYFLKSDEFKAAISNSSQLTDKMKKYYHKFNNGIKLSNQIKNKGDHKKFKS